MERKAGVCSIHLCNFEYSKLKDYCKNVTQLGLQIVSTERMVFDVLGRMWITLVINGLTGIASLVCIMGLYFRKKSAIISVSVIYYQSSMQHASAVSDKLLDYSDSHSVILSHLY